MLYAAKAFLCGPIARIVADEGLGMDVVSGEELAVARSAGFPMEDVYFHGNNKGPEELKFAVSEQGIGRVVVDSFHELELLNGVAGEAGVTQAVLLRVSPNVDASTHAKTTTGILDTKFGFAIETGDAEKAVVAAMAATHLDLRGLHVHLGSPIFGLEPYRLGSGVMATFAARMGDTHGFEMHEYSPGGGFALAYTRDDDPPAIDAYAKVLTESMAAGLAEHRLSRPSIHIEPGRSLVGGAVMALYTVGARKEIPGVRTYVSVDGGMADNIRPRYVRIAVRSGARRTTTRRTCRAHTSRWKILRERRHPREGRPRSAARSRRDHRLAGQRRLQPGDEQQLQHGASARRRFRACRRVTGDAAAGNDRRLDGPGRGLVDSPAGATGRATAVNIGAFW